MRTVTYVEATILSTIALLFLFVYLPSYYYAMFQKGLKCIIQGDKNTFKVRKIRRQGENKSRKIRVRNEV